MADARHRQAKHRKPRSLLVPRAAKVAIPGAAVALLASASASALPAEAPQQATPTAAADLSKRTERPDRSSRSSRTDRPKPKPTAQPKATPTTGAEATAQSSTKPLIEGSKYVTTELNVWPEPDEGGDLLTVLDTGDKVNVTGEEDGAWAEILQDGKARWVRSEYLSSDKPEEEEASDGGSGGGVSTKECTNGAEINSGVTEDAQRVFRAVCAKFPSITQYLTTESGSGEHGSGRAVDIMVDDYSLGMEIRDYLRANAGALGVSELIYRQQIWTVQRSGEGWRSMEDRGSPSANHMDHVHVTVYGSSGTA